MHHTGTMFQGNSMHELLMVSGDCESIYQFRLMFRAFEPNVTHSARFFLHANDPNDLKHKNKNKNFRDKYLGYFYATKLTYQMYQKQPAMLSNLHLKYNRRVN